MKRLYIGILLSLFSLLTLQAQESESNIPRILEFDCSYREVTSLDVIGCTALTSLRCNNNQLSSLDVSGCTALETLYCYDNQLSSLDVSGCTALETLYCYDNQLSSLDVIGCTALTSLRCNNNQLSSLDVSGCTALASLDCVLNDLTSLDVSGCTALASLDCVFNDLTSLDVSGLTALETLDCRYNDLSSLDVSGCTALEGVDCENNQLSSLDVSGCTALTSLGCSYNQLSSLDVSGCTALTSLGCRYNDLSSLDVSGCTALGWLSCSYNQLSSLDVSGCTALRSLYCSYNQLSSLDVSKNTALRELDCSFNISQVLLSDERGFDLSTLPGMDVKRVRAMRGGHIEGSILYFDADGVSYVYDVGGGREATFCLIAPHSGDVCDTLQCEFRTSSSVGFDFYGFGRFLVDWGDGSRDTLTGGGSGDQISVSHSYVSSGCNTVRLCGLEGKDRLLDLSCRGKELSSLDVCGCTALTSLDCSYNQLSSLDVSGCTALTSLDCDDNQLTSIDVSRNTALTSLSCDDNQLNSIDVSKNTALTSLSCDNNQLSSLDVSRNTALGSLYCRYNRIPLSGLYETYSGFPSSDVEYYIEGQSDSIVLLVGEAFDLSSERRIENEFSTYKIKSATGNVLPSYLYEEQGFVFRFNEEYTYLLELQNPSVSDISDDYYYDENVTFTWHITVLESLADYLTVQVAANHAEWGRVSVAGNGRFKAGATATVTATPNAGYRFVSWTKKDGTVLSTQAAYTFTVMENVELTANFAEAERHTVLLSARPSGWGEAYQSGGGLYAEGERVTIIATAKTGYHFINWTRKDGAVFTTEATHTFTVAEDIELTANFGEQRPETHTVELSVNNEAYGSVSQTGSGTYEQGAEATITATAKEGHRFINWTKKDGTVFTTEATHTFTVTEDIELTANFEKRAEEADTYTVLLSANNNDYGRVSQTGDGTYEAGEEVTITATAKAGYRFVNWTEKDGTVFSTQAVHTFAVTENLELTANFEEEEPETYTVVLSANPPAWGSVYQTGGGIYEEGSQATVIAMANAGYRFVNWTEKDGGVFATEAAHTFTVTEDVALTANFEKLPDAGNEDLTEDNLYVYVKDHTIYLSSERGLVRVYNAAGVCVYSGYGTAIPVHSGGLYIVRVGECAYKAVVR